jgi:hypothetical protein
VAPVRFSDGRSTYIPNTVPGAPAGVRTPGSLANQALSVYSRPNWAVGLSADRAAAQAALNQRLIQEAMERARERAEEIRRQIEERRRKLEEEQAARDQMEARGGMGTLGAVPPAQRGLPTVIPSASQGSYLSTGERADMERNAVDINAGDVSLSPVSVSSDFRTDNKALADSMAAKRGMEVIDLGNGLYGLRDPRQEPGLLGAEGWTRRVIPGIVSDRMYQSAQRRDLMAEKTEMYEGSPNFKELALRYEGDDMERYWSNVHRAQINIWGDPVAITEKRFTGRYDENGMKIYDDVTVGWDWDADVEAPMQDPNTGALLSPADSNRPSYLGMIPGDIVVNLPPRPAADADIDEWRRYYNGLKSSVATPLYKPESPMETLQRMDVKSRARFQKQLVAAQLISTDETIIPGQMDQTTLETMAGLMAEANFAGITWEVRLSQALQEAAIRKAESSGGGGYGGGGGGGGTTTYKQIQYTQTSVAQARSMLIGVLTEALGRYPTDEEVAEFLKIVNKQERKSPTKTVTRTTTEGDMTRAVSRTTPSTVDAQALAEEFAQGVGGGAPAEANAAANYLAGFLESLGAR